MNLLSRSLESGQQWQSWASWLRSRGLAGAARWLLEAGDPWRILGAQLFYMGQPFWGGENLASIAALLEDDEQSKAFAALLEDS